MGEIMIYILVLIIILVVSFLVVKYTKPDIVIDDGKIEKPFNCNVTDKEIKKTQVHDKTWYVNPHTGVKRYAITTKFSWTVLLFGCFVPLARSDYKYFAIMICVNLIGAWFIGCLIMAFLYNDLHQKELINNGYVLLSDKM